MTNCTASSQDDTVATLSLADAVDLPITNLSMKPMVVVGFQTNGVGCGVQCARFRSPPPEEVDNVNASKPPPPRTAATASDRRIIGIVGGGARVVHDPEQGALAAMQGPPESVAMLPTLPTRTQRRTARRRVAHARRGSVTPRRRHCPALVKLSRIACSTSRSAVCFALVVDLAGELSPLSDEAQDSDGQRGGGDDGADHPADEPGFEIRDPGPLLGAQLGEAGPLLGAQFGDLRREPRVEVRNLGPQLGEAGPELVGGDVVALR